MRKSRSGDPLPAWPTERFRPMDGFSFPNRAILIGIAAVLIACPALMMFPTAWAQSAPGDLIIVTKPPGAAIYREDGIIEGLSPQEIILLEEGTHEITMELEGYLKRVEKVKVESGVRLEYDFALTPTAGMISCPNCGHLFDDPSPAPTGHKRGKDIFSEVNFLIYSAARMLAPFGTGMAGGVLMINNPGRVVKAFGGSPPR